MFGVGTGEILLILVIAMLVVGPERMVTFSRQLGHLVAQFRRTTDEATQEFREAFSLEDGEAASEPDAASASAAGPAPAPASVTVEAAGAAEDAGPAGPQEAPVTLKDVLADELVDGEIEVQEASQPASTEAKPEAESAAGATEETVIELATLVPEDRDVEPMIIETADVVPPEATSSPADTEV